jgi:hypothetical protein
MRQSPVGCAALALSACLLSAANARDPEARSTVADVIALTVCVIDADIRTAAIAQMQRGASQHEALAEVRRAMPDAAYRAQAERLVAEVYRARPPSLRAYVAERLQRCAAGAARRVNPPAADGCYQLTRFASDFFAAREAGVPREQALASVRAMARESGLESAGEQALAALAASVYATEVAAPDFRAGLFFHCVLPSPR